MLEALQAIGPAAFLRTSFYLYPLLNSAHILAIAVLVTTAILMDARVLGLGAGISADTVVRTLRPIAIWSLAAAAVTGFLLFSVQPVDYAANPAFLIKMAVLAAAVVNAALFTTFRAHRRPGAAAPRLMAALSICLWITVLIFGRFIGYLA